MRNASMAFKKKLLDDNRNYKIKLVITLADDTVLNITEQNIWGSSLKFTDDTSSNSNFDLGSAIINKLNFALNNMYNTYSTYDFNNATVICHVGLTLDDETTEYLKIGHYTVYEQPTYNGSLISFTCYDNMYKFDKKITSITGATMGEAIQDMCNTIGISLIATDTDIYHLPITIPSEVTKMTYRQLLSYICQLTGDFARINNDGQLEIKWYDTDFYSSEPNLDGGTFDTKTTPYSDGDTADGGNFTDYSSGANIDGGTFAELSTFHHIYSMNSQSFSTDDVIITGIKLVDSSQNEYPIGTTEYMLAIINNPLVTSDNAGTYVCFLNGKLVGMRFRKFNAKCLSDPTIEAGDNVKVSDNKGHTYVSFVNSTSFNIGNFQSVACNCASPLQNSSERNSATTQAIINARKVAVEQVSAYDLLVKQMTDLIANGFGVFKSEVIDENGGTIYYTHDKKLMSDSSVRWYQTSEGQIEQNKILGEWITVSAQDSSGNALVRVLTAIGINAEWIKIGTELGGFTINSDTLSSLMSETFGPYVEADIDIIKTFILGQATPTEADLTKYDIDGNGIITSLDMFYVQRIILGTYPDITDGAFSINPKSVRNTLTIGRTSGPGSGNKTILGAGNISTKAFDCDTMTDCIQTGTYSLVGNTSDGWTSVDVPFSNAFTNIPKVFLTNTSAFSNENVKATNETRTGFTLSVYGCLDFTVSVNWLATTL